MGQVYDSLKTAQQHVLKTKSDFEISQKFLRDR